MRRLALKTLALPWLLSALPTTVRSADALRITIGANPGGGFDQVGRAIGAAMQQAGVSGPVSYDNKGGAGGMIALAQFVNDRRGDPNALIVTGAVMVGAIVRNNPPITLADATPIARLMTEYNVFAVPANSPVRTLRDVIERMKQDPTSVKWGGGSKGSIDQLAVAMFARELGIDAGRVNYVPFNGGGEVAAAMLGGHVTVGISGWGELKDLVANGQARAIAVTAPQPVKSMAVPTLVEQGLDVAISNWRGVYGAPQLSTKQRQSLTDAVVRGTRAPGWVEAGKWHGWTTQLLTGAEFERFVEAEHVRLRALMRELGLR